MLSLDFKNSWLGWKDLPETKEGRCTDGFLEYMYDLIKNNRPKNILEIGFNGGHSACCFLNANPSAKMYTFDICRWGIEDRAISILKNYFDINLIKGNSVHTIPKFFEENQILFDLILIDGCHDYDVVISDIKNTINFLNDDGFLVIDDIHMGGVYNAIKNSGLDETLNSKVIEVKITRYSKYLNKSVLSNPNDRLEIKRKELDYIIRPFVTFKKGKL